jgi:predicted Fe-Mo cluster-binding NifX family protein
LGVDTLICGAISRPLAYMITTAGINLIAWISGQVEDVLQAFLRGNVFDIQFLMPGSHGHWGKGPGRGYGRGRKRRGIHFP